MATFERDVCFLRRDVIEDAEGYAMVYVVYLFRADYRDVVFGGRVERSVFHVVLVPGGGVSVGAWLTECLFIDGGERRAVVL